MIVNGYHLSDGARALHEQHQRQLSTVQAATMDSGAVISGNSEMFEWFGGGARAAGINVTPETAMRTSVVWRCVTLIAGAKMVLPLGVYERTGGAPIRLPDHDLVRFLQFEPNEHMSGPEFIERQSMAVLTRGNGYGLIRQARNGVITSVDYYHPTQVMPYWSNKTVWYRLTNLDGSTEDHHSSEMLHFKGAGLTADGLHALSPVQHHAQAIGIGLAARDYTAGQFERGMLTNDYFQFSEGISAEQREAFKTYLKRKAQGVANAHNPLLLEKGAEWKQMSVSAKDAQLLELLQYSTADIARIFGVPPHMVGEVDKSTSWGTGIEQQGIGFVRYTVLPHLVRFAGEWSRKLFPVVGRQVSKYYIDFDPEALMQGDMKAQGEYARIALGGNQLPGFMTVNEVRRMKNLPPMTGGDEIYIPNGTPAVPDTQNGKGTADAQAA